MDIDTIASEEDLIRWLEKIGDDELDEELIEFDDFMMESYYD